MKTLAGKVAVVTGGNRGIGQAIALTLASAGASIAIAARDEKANKIIKEELQELNVEHLVQFCDIREEQQIDHFISCVEHSLGPVSILINNAGIYKTSPIQDHLSSLWQDIINTNLTSSFFTSRRVLRNMLSLNWGRIINISSISGKVAEAYAAAYSASKFGIIGLTQSLALEVAKHNITVNAICPSWVLTNMVQEQLDSDDFTKTNYVTPYATDSTSSISTLEIARLSIPQQRFIEPTEIANLVIFLCSQAACGITGQAINICGGSCLH